MQGPFHIFHCPLERFRGLPAERESHLDGHPNQWKAFRMPFVETFHKQHKEESEGSFPLRFKRFEKGSGDLKIDHSTLTCLSEVTQAGPLRFSSY